MYVVSRKHLLVLCSALVLSPVVARASGPGTHSRLSVTVDSGARQVVLTLGTYQVPRDTGMSMMMDMQADEERSPRFIWPRDTWLRGYRIEVSDGAGRRVPSRLLHHFSLVDFDRRELAYPIVWRVFGGGEETGDVMLPPTVGVPVSAGDHVGFYFMWHNDGDRDLDGVTIRIALTWIPRNQQPQPTLAMPFWVDVNYQAGGMNEFDDPPGGCVKSYAFTLPIGGHLLAAGGHLHAYGASIRIEDPSTGKVIVRVTADRDANGELRKVSRQLFGLWGSGPHLEADHRYLLVVTYDNPTTRDNPDVMGLVGGLFVPDDLRRWPTLDRTDPTYLADIVGFGGADPRESSTVSARVP